MHMGTVITGTSSHSPHNVYVFRSVWKHWAFVINNLRAEQCATIFLIFRLFSIGCASSFPINFTHASPHPDNNCLSFRAILLLEQRLQHDKVYICWGCPGMQEWRFRDRQGGADVRCVEAPGLRQMRCGLVGRRQRALPHLQPQEALQPHRGSRPLCWFPRQEAQAVRCLLLPGFRLRGERCSRIHLFLYNKKRAKTHVGLTL